MTPRCKICGRLMNKMEDGKYRCGHGWNTPQNAEEQRKSDIAYKHYIGGDVWGNILGALGIGE